MKLCPCNSQKEYSVCCGVYIDNQATPQTPEALMRSRYTAYTQANIDYIKKTMCGKASIAFNETEAAAWAKRVNWQSLKVIESFADEINPNLGYVEFIARFRDDNKNQLLHECSQFELRDGCWFYTDSIKRQTELTAKKPKIARNAICHCGSQRKFKNCHGK